MNNSDNRTNNKKIKGAAKFFLAHFIFLFLLSSAPHAGFGPLHVAEKAEAGNQSSEARIVQGVPERGYIIELEEEPVFRTEVEAREKIKKGALTPQQAGLQMAARRANIQNERAKVRANISGILGAKKAEPLREYDHVFNGMVLDITEEEAQRIAGIPGVKKVYPNKKVTAFLSNSVPVMQGGISAGELDADGNDCTITLEPCFDGDGIVIAIIDTGIDYTHPDLGGCTEQEFLDGECDKVIGGWNFSASGDSNNPIDGEGHGTHVASIAAGNGGRIGVAPGAQLLAYKVLDDNGGGTESDIISGIEQAVLDGADIMNLSLGGPGNPDDAMSQAADNAAEAGVVVVAAAGNCGPQGNSIQCNGLGIGLGEQTIASPGVARNVITVGASNNSDVLASFSSRGPVIWEDNGTKVSIAKPDILAPGVSIEAANLGSGHISQSGTSMAAPHIAGAVAVLKQKHASSTPEEFKRMLTGTALDLDYGSHEQGVGRAALNDAIKIETNPIEVIVDMEVHAVTSTINITGTAQGSGFEEYEVFYRHREIETGWISLCSATSSVVGGVLCENFDTTTATSGEYFLKLEAYGNPNATSTALGLIFIDNPVNVSTCQELHNIKNNLSGTFFVVDDIDCSMTDPADPGFDPSGPWSDEKGFDPIGFFNTAPYGAFRGSFDGGNHKITDLYINRPGEEDVGLFGHTNSPANINNIGLEAVSVIAGSYVGGLVGDNRGTVFEAYTTGSISSNNNAGGLAGLNLGTISNSYSRASASGSSVVGGFVGRNHGGSILKSYSTGGVPGSGSNVGGFVGMSSNGGTATDSFWDTETSSATTSASGTGKTTAEMKDVATFTATSTEGLDSPWDFAGSPNDDEGEDAIWNMDDDEIKNAGYPYLRLMENEYFLTIETEGGGTVAQVPNKPAYAFGEEIELSASSSEEWTFDEWTGDTEHITTGTISDEQVTVTMPAENISLTANFEPIPISPSATTTEATVIGENTATLNGTADPGDEPEIEVFFMWREEGAGSFATTSKDVATTSGSFNAELSGLNSGTNYEFKIVAEWSGGASSTEGMLLSFTTATPPPPSGGGGSSTPPPNDNADLTSLVVEEGELSPEFAPDVLEYTIYISEDVLDINTIAEVADTGKALLVINGELHPSGETKTISMSTSTPEIVINYLVVAENGTEKEYKVTIFRTAPEEEVVIVPLVDTSIIPEGAMFSAEGDRRVFIRKGNFKRWIVSSAIMDMYGHLRWEDIVAVSMEEANTLKESSLIKLDGDPRVFRVDTNSRTKHWIQTADVLFGLGYSFDMIYTVNETEFNFYPEGDPVTESNTLPTGVNIRAFGSSVIYYITEAGLKRALPSLEVFNSYPGNSKNDIIEVSAEDLNKYPDNVLIHNPPNPRVYFLDNGVKRWIPNEEIFNKHGFNWRHIAPVNETEFSAYTEGSPLE